MTWTVELGRGRGLLRRSDRIAPAELAEMTRSLQGAVLAAAAEQGVPRLARARVVAEYRPAPPRPGIRKQQAAALFDAADDLLPSARAAVTALVDAGVLPSDPSRLSGPIMRRGDPEPGSHLVLYITAPDLDAS